MCKNEGGGGGSKAVLKMLKKTDDLVLEGAPNYDGYADNDYENLDNHDCDGSVNSLFIFLENLFLCSFFRAKTTASSSPVKSESASQES